MVLGEAGKRGRRGEEGKGEGEAGVSVWGREREERGASRILSS